MKAYLPNFLKFKTAEDLIRIGRKNDGGYLISKKDIQLSDFLISFGVCDDWSFEEDILNHKRMPLIAYDGTISLKTFFYNLFKSLLKLNNPRYLPYSIKKIITYIIFFRGTKKHIKKNVSDKVKNNSNFISIQDIFKTTSSKNIFLKIDIEGYEYRILEELLNNEDRINGMVIEFHDCDLHLDKLKTFIQKLRLSIVHIHANNYGNIESNQEIPSVLEITFSKNSDFKKKYFLPHDLDMPNNPKAEEIILNFNEF